jgi:PA14 domain
MTRIHAPAVRAVVLLSCALTMVTAYGMRLRAQQPIPLTPGMVIDRSVVIKPGTCLLSASADLKTPVISVRGESLSMIADDGARVWVDGELVLDAWEPHESKVDTVPLPGGMRRFKVEYHEIGGFAELRFTIQRK